MVIFGIAIIVMAVMPIVMNVIIVVQVKPLLLKRMNVDALLERLKIL